ncbi:hypothetical protein [Macrococcoides caseolyticum]|uniref:Uncharacterized protein n=1 Tax=Macrococcus caseolyticus (strain JCSC5402) TaxID=458233 RepID=B9EC69_MACCJ|nr:hypothetical protein [Macrococcus caseolyticus]BAH18677.1 hypothetical protein MCCL_plsA0013 [Macrococcus caseolyticus JCSC5402]
MFTFLYYVMPVCIIALCLFGMFLWLSSQIDHLRSLRFTVPVSLIVFIIGITMSTWTPLSPLPFYQQHLHVQKVNEQYKVAESYLDNLMNKGFLDFNTTVKKHVTHRHFSVAQQKINRIDDREKRKSLMNKHSEYLAIYEQRIGDNLIRKIQLEHLSVSEYNQLTAQEYNNVRYQIRQQIQNPQTEKDFLEHVQKLQKDHDSLYNYR